MHGIGRCPFFISPANCVFEYVYVQSFYGSADVHSEIASIWAFGQTVGDTTFRYNLFTHSYSTGGIMWDNSTNHNAHLYIYGNVFYYPSGETWQGGNGLIGGWTGGNHEDCYGMRIYNNTFINIPIAPFTDFQLRYGDNIAYNNLFYNSTSPRYGTIPTHDCSHYINSGGVHSESHGTSGASGDPFVNYVGLDFGLKANTEPGADLGAPYNIDPLGRTRTTWTRGAYEYVDPYDGTPPAPPTGLTIE
jgi:hypothetical protein